MTKSLQLGLMIVASLSVDSPSFADSLYGPVDSSNDVQINAWGDLQPLAQHSPNVMTTQMYGAPPSAPYYASAPSQRSGQHKTSRRTNTNLSWRLPPTVTCTNTDLNLVDDLPSFDPAMVIDDSYYAANLILDRIEASK